jgi:RecB family endonuclease NucS
MKRIQVWSVEEEDGRLRAKGLDEIASAETEQRLEELLVATPELLLDGLSLIGRQLPSEAPPRSALSKSLPMRSVLVAAAAQC